MKIVLPDKLSGKEYEEAVGAYLKAIGYFTEKRVILSYQGRELLELDIVASPSNESINERILIDAKSGKKTGFSDIFKIFGWKTFLRIPYGCIIRKTKPDDNDEIAINNYYDELKMSWEIFNLEGEVSLNLSKTIPQILETEDALVIHHFINAWWFAIAERIVFSQYQKFIRSCPEKELIDKVKTYEKVCNLSFFEKNPLKRVISLYKAFRDNPYISKSCIAYVASQKDISERDIQNSIFNTADYLWVQYVLLLEHRARYLIIKCAVEIIKTPESGNEWTKLTTTHLIATTPINFQQGLSALKENRYCLKIPYLLQVFLESFGGFYIDSNDADLKLLSDVTQIPEDDVIGCLEILNIFFPTGGSGWFLNFKDVRTLKYVPAFVRGIGSFMRKNQICNQYDELTKMDWLLAKYHNAVLEVIAKDEKLKKDS